jgi:hypothetical protein
LILVAGIVVPVRDNKIPSFGESRNSFRDCDKGKMGPGFRLDDGSSVSAGTIPNAVNSAAKDGIH